MEMGQTVLPSLISRKSNVYRIYRTVAREVRYLLLARAAQCRINRLGTWKVMRNPPPPILFIFCPKTVTVVLRVREIEQRT